MFHGNPRRLESGTAELAEMREAGIALLGGEHPPQGWHARRLLEEAEIAEIVGTARDPDAATRAIVSRARAKGSTDDITAVVVELEEW